MFTLIILKTYNLLTSEVLTSEVKQSYSTIKSDIWGVIGNPGSSTINISWDISQEMSFGLLRAL